MLKDLYFDICFSWQIFYASHTRLGSLQTCVYEGVKDDSASNASEKDISELIGADIVLTTYDVLRADLSHDSDRHEGDRRLLRFHKRYVKISVINCTKSQLFVVICCRGRQ